MTIEQETLAPAGSDRKLLRSPVLNQFHLNAYALLNLPFGATADEAIWKSEEMLTLARGEVSPPEINALSWLPAAQEQELRLAVQVLEEPLRRIAEQFFWFDFEGDPNGQNLKDAICDLDGTKL